MLIHVINQVDQDYIRSLFWHDSRLVSGTITRCHQEEFSNSICYDGYHRINIHLEYEMFNGGKLKLIFAGCKYLEYDLLDAMSLSKIKINFTQNIKMNDEKGNSLIDASALLYEIG